MKKTEAMNTDELENQEQELDEDQLDQVAGGNSPMLRPFANRYDKKKK